jgi:hypothetical protein
MTTQEVANRYMELEKQGKHGEIKAELYSNDVVCIEPEHAVAMGMQTVTIGLEAGLAKGKKLAENIEEIHSGYHTEPVVVGNFFSMAMGFDATYKIGGRRKFDEIAVFEVKDGKIIKEQFFY